MYRTHDEHGSPDFKGSDTNLFTNEQHSDDSPSNGAMGFLSRGLTRGKSLLNRNKQKPSMNRGEEQEPAYVQNSSSPERDANGSLQEGTDFLSSNNPSQTTDNNPFDVGTGRADAQNPFESESVNAPYTHIRNESHISGLTNNLRGFLLFESQLRHFSSYLDWLQNQWGSLPFYTLHSAIQSEFIRLMREKYWQGFIFWAFGFGLLASYRGG